MKSQTGFEKQKIRRAFLEIEQLKRARIQEVLLSLGLTPGHGQARTLMALLRLESASQKELAVECLLDVTTMSRTLDRLQNMGLVERRRDPMSRRTFRVSLTEEGKTVYRYAVDVLNYCGSRTTELLSLLEQAKGSIKFGLPPSVGSVFFFQDPA